VLGAVEEQCNEKMVRAKAVKTGGQCTLDFERRVRRLLSTGMGVEAIGKPVGRPTQHKGGREVGDERGAKSRHGASPLP